MKWLFKLLRYDSYLLIYQKNGEVMASRNMSMKQFVDWIASWMVKMCVGDPLTILQYIEARIIEIQESRKQGSFVENQALSEMLRSEHPIN